jgi:hypothetical protein
MATISSMTNNTYLMYRFAEKQGVSAVTGQSTSTPSSLSALQSLTSKTSSSASSASGRTSTSLYGASSSASDLQTLNGIREGYAGLVSSYDETKNIFQTEMKSTISDLSSSAKTVAGMSYDFSAADITTNADGSKTYSDSLQGALKNVKALVSDYNDALSFFADNKGVSKRASGLATAFADTTYRADQYGAIGIHVDSATGRLSVDEDKLATALTTEGSRVENTLGSNGLAGKAEDHAALASFQQDKVFPSMQSMLGGETTVASLYNGRTLSAISGYMTTGNLLNLLF